MQARGVTAKKKTDGSLLSCAPRIVKWTRREGYFMLRVSYQELFNTLLRVLLKQGFAPERARRCAQLLADATATVSTLTA